MNIKSFLLSVALLLNVTACQASTSIDEVSVQQVSVAEVDKTAYDMSLILDTEAKHVIVNSFAYMNELALASLPIEAYQNLYRADVDPQARKIMHMMNRINQMIDLHLVEKEVVQESLNGVYDHMDLALVHVNAAYSKMSIAQSDKPIDVRIDALADVMEHIDTFKAEINKAAKHHLVLNALASGK